MTGQQYNLNLFNSSGAVSALSRSINLPATAVLKITSLVDQRELFEVQEGGQVHLKNSTLIIGTAATPHALSVHPTLEDPFTVLRSNAEPIIDTSSNGRIALGTTPQPNIDLILQTRNNGNGGRAFGIQKPNGTLLFEVLKNGGITAHSLRNQNANLGIGEIFYDTTDANRLKYNP